MRKAQCQAASFQKFMHPWTKWMLRRLSVPFTLFMYNIHSFCTHTLTYTHAHTHHDCAQPAGSVTNRSCQLSFLKRKLNLTFPWDIFEACVCLWVCRESGEGTGGAQGGHRGRELESYRAPAGSQTPRLSPRCSLTRRCKCPRLHLSPGSDGGCCRCGFQIWKQQKKKL